MLLKLYLYGYLNRVQSSRRLEREAGRNVELMWLTGRLVPDHKTIADFRKDYGSAIRKVCAQFIILCRRLDLLADASVVIDRSKFKAVNNRDRNFTRAKMSGAWPKSRRALPLRQLDSADRQKPSEVREAKTVRLKEKVARLKQEVQRLHGLKAQMLAAPDQQISMTDPRLPFDGDQWPGVGRCRLQRPSRSRYQAPSDHHPRGDQRRQRPAQLAHMAKQAKATLELCVVFSLRHFRLAQWYSLSLREGAPKARPRRISTGALPSISVLRKRCAPIDGVCAVRATGSNRFTFAPIGLHRRMGARTRGDRCRLRLCRIPASSSHEFGSHGPPASRVFSSAPSQGLLKQ